MKDKIITISFIIFLELFFILNIVIKDNDISYEERRKLNQFPKITLNNISDTSFMNNFEDYTLDQFPFRNSFRTLKANYNYYILQKLDNNDIYINKNGIFKIEYPTNIDSINNFIDKVNNIISNTTTNNNIYSVIIPDKNYYVEDELFLKLNYDLIYKELEKLKTTKIDIRNTMNLNDYYHTDTHWKQENLIKVIKKLDKKMNFNYFDIEYDKNIYNEFYGVYYGQAALNRKPDTITYLTNDIQNELKVTYLENEKLNTIYNLSKLNSLDSYEIFLDGASSFITIENNNISSDKELIIYRDSFGSSIIPLLAPYYKKIIIVDTRYVTNDYLKDKIEFTNQDILFLYSTLLVNNSFSLKN